MNCHAQPNEPEKFSYFPAFVSVAGRKVVVFGGGKAALGKLRLLLRTEAAITVVSQNLSLEIQAMHERNEITHVKTDFDPAVVQGAVLVFDAGGDEALTAQIRQEAAKHNIFVNVVDRTEACDFITPAILDRAPVMVTISTNGCAPALARMLRQRLELAIPNHVGKLAAVARDTRRLVVERLTSGFDRNRFWTRFFQDEAVRKDVVERDLDARRVTITALQRFFGDNAKEKAQGIGMRHIGVSVTDPQELPKPVATAIQTADVILHDGAISGDILALARRDAHCISIPSIDQGEQMPESVLVSGTIQQGGHVLCLHKDGLAALQ